MTPQQTSLFDAPKVASVRRSDPRPARTAAAEDPNGRNHQRTLILEFLRHHGPATADECATVIQRHRSVASTRLNVLVKAGLVEACGLKACPSEYGVIRDVTLYRVIR